MIRLFSLGIRGLIIPPPLVLVLIVYFAGNVSSYFYASLGGRKTLLFDRVVFETSSVACEWDGLYEFLSAFEGLTRFNLMIFFCVGYYSTITGCLEVS